MQIEKFIEYFTDVKKTGRGYTARCPAHDDKNPSLAIALNDTDKNKIIVTCFAKCQTEKILNAAGLKLSDLYNEKQSSSKKIVAEYNYKDQTGKLIHQTVRYFPKEFRQRQPNGSGWIWNLKGIQTVLYNLPKLIQAISSNEIVVVVEGEQDCDNLGKYGIIATTCASGANGWLNEYNSIFKDSKVVIIPDNDATGRAYATKVYQCLSQVTKLVRTLYVPNLSEKQDISNYIENEVKNGLSKTEISEKLKLMLAQTFEVAIPGTHEATFEDLDKMLAEVSWAWEKWLPNGFLTMIASESGKGKSYISLKIASSFITGVPFPDGSKITSENLGKILWCDSEASQSINLQRAKNWKIPLNKIVIPFDDKPLQDVQLDNFEHREIIRSKALQEEIKIVVIDSLSGANKKDENKIEVAEIVKFLAELARDTNKPVMLVHHLNKPVMGTGNQAVTLNRLRGSSAIVQYARVVWAIDEPNENNKTHRRLSVIKSNLCKIPKSIGFKIDDNSELSFTEAPEEHTHFIKEKSAIEKATEFLNELLKDNPMPQVEIITEAEVNDITKSSLKRAKEEMGIASFRKNDKWFWRLKNE